ncbi:unnamed protein product [marine sediment metagenome]|uniref:Zinc-ribbon domain-containing protein n=1 Tax=marine sediment metagenome TaxID=412755 RepID=X1AM38_9ZZZZ
MTAIDSLKSQYSSKRKKLFFTFILIVISVVILLILKETSIVEEWWQIGIIIMSLILIFGSQATNYISTEQNYRNALYTSNKMLKKDTALDYTVSSYLMSKQENEAQTKNKTEENEIKSVSFCISCGKKFAKKYTFCPSCGSCKITSY